MSSEKDTNLRLPKFKKVTYEDIKKSVDTYIKATESESDLKKNIKDGE